MKPLVKLIVEYKSALANLTAQLSTVFGDAISILPFSMDDPAAYIPKHENAIVTSAFSSADFPEIKRTHLAGKTLIPIEMNLRKKSLLQLNAYPKGTKLLLVNISKFMAEEVIAQLYQAGYGHLNFVPYYPGCSITERIPLAVTPGEASLVPDFVTECVDLGFRQIATATIVELATKTGCEYILRTKRFLDFFELQYAPSAGISTLVTQNDLLEQRLSDLVQLFSPGLIGIDANQLIFNCNFQAAALLGSSRMELLQKNAAEFFPQDMIDKCLLQKVDVISKFRNPKTEEDISVRLAPLAKGEDCAGAYIILQAADGQDTESQHNTLIHKGYIAKYRFSDICGSDPQISQVILLAQKMARTESSVLITGESGTGKEIFAHAIHNNSRRASAPFVAINCAALPDSLLESELFGYEEGAFTGAKKGGKIGLFELANSGTIFLDEIEGMSPNTQLKLLRVIQEREMMRVGGDKIIPIDVRVISASNQDLFQLIQDGKFRSDLFYRVSTLPLNLPPLRQRKKDILPLIEVFKSQLALTFVLTEETKTILQQYRWPGNIRELRNCVEYMGCQSVPVIEPEHLPYSICTLTLKKSASSAQTENLETELFQILWSENCGRSQLQKKLKSRGILVTENQLRKKLEEFKEKGWITSKSGRAGSQLTQEGKQEFENRLK